VYVYGLRKKRIKKHKNAEKREREKKKKELEAKETNYVRWCSILLRVL
jgi:hypothetical protein